MTTPAQILALLTGTKTFDGRQWRVFDAGGSELADPGGVLWRGVHGALLWNANYTASEPEPFFKYYSVNEKEPEKPRTNLADKVRQEDDILLAMLEKFVLEVA